MPHCVHCAIPLIAYRRQPIRELHDRSEVTEHHTNCTNLSIKLCSDLKSNVRHSYVNPFSQQPCSASAKVNRANNEIISATDC